jgi:general secretion pathway protein L
MSILVVLIPPRSRLRARGTNDVGPDSLRASTEFNYVVSPDGMDIESQGRSAPALLPRGSTSVVAVLADADVSWHRITLPRAPAARLRAALSGVLEEQLLDDAENIHLALAPEAVAGAPVWVAATNRPWLRTELAALEKARIFVDRVVPGVWPDEPPAGHFAQAHANEDGAASVVTLTWSHSDGVAQFTLKGALTRALLPSPTPIGTRWSATPGAAGAAEQWLGSAVTIVTPGQRALQASRSLWNLRQFELSARNRGARAIRDIWRRFFGQEWKPTRAGLAALAATLIVGLNLWAWHQGNEVQNKRQAMDNLLRTTFPNVRSILDAPLQMQRETEALQAAAGRPAAADLEPMMQAAAGAWPNDRPAVETVRYEPGRLTLAAAGWSPSQIDQFRSQLQPAGWQVEAADGRLTLSRARTGPSPGERGVR